MEDRTVPAQAIPVGPDLSLIGPGPNSGTKVGDSLYFLAHQSTDAAGVTNIWHVDGSATATELSVPALAGMSVSEMASMNGTLYVTASSVPSGTPSTLPDVNLWKIDPTAPGGAVELTHFTGSGASDLQVVGNKLVFEHASFTGLMANQPGELWVSDGTAAATQLLSSFTGDAHPSLMESAVAGNDLYFQVFSSTVPPALWVTDGTTSGTHAVTSTGGAIPALNGLTMTAAGDAVYFGGSDPANNKPQLWTAQDGQASLVHSFNAVAGGPVAPALSSMTVAGNSIYFALNGSAGSQLWVSDGTDAGTTLVYQPSTTPGPTSPEIGDIALLNGSAYFTVVNGGGLMKADGQGGATQVPLPANLSGFAVLTAVGNRLYFMADDGVHGTELWTTDGTAGGTVRLTDINPGSGSSFPIGPEAAGGSLYVIASDGIATDPTTFAAEKVWKLPDPAAPAGAAVTATLTPSATTVVTGGPITLTASVTAAGPSQPAPTGQVVFRDELQVYGTAPLVNGVATLNTSIPVPGTHNLQAVYTGNDTFDEAISPTVTVTAGQSGTTIALTTSDASINPGDSVTFTATVTPTLASSQSPTGSVNFFDGTTFLGTGFINGGVASFQTSSLSAGAHSITANYAGDLTFTPSTSAPLTETVGPVFTVGLTASRTSLAFGQPITLTAHITPAPGTSLPTGLIVLFRDAATPLGSAAVGANGNATLSLPNLGVGSHSVSAAVFNAAAEFDSPAIAVTVHKAATTVSLRSTAPTARQGQPITLTATISPPAAGMTSLTGTVTFADGPAILGTATVANGRAVLLVSNLAVGNHPIEATYSGDGNYSPSSATLTQTITAATVTTTTTITPSTTAAVVGDQIALSAHVIPAVGTATPTGSVTFREGATLLGAVVIDHSGQALLLTNSLGTGTHSITATFGGAGIFSGSTSAPVSITVKLGARARLTAGADSVTAGQGVTLTANVAAAAGGALQPAGSVTFYDGTRSLGTAALQNGVAHLTTGAFHTVGLHRLTATYGGNSLFPTTTAGTVYLNVRAAGTTTALQPPSQPAAGTGTVTLSATVTVKAPATGSPTGSVKFLDGNTSLGTAPVVNGHATLQISRPAAGSHFLRAVFSGTGGFAGSSSAVVRYTIAATTSTSLQAPPATFGQTIQLKATVSVLSPGFGKATGKVTFKDGSTILGTALLHNGVATFGAKLGRGLHNLTASFEGTSDFAASRSAAMSYTVGQATPTLTFRATPPAPKFGTNVTFRADIGPAFPGAAHPDGSILFTEGTTILGVGTITDGQVIMHTTRLARGTHVLTATYSGDTNYKKTTATLSLTIA
jgi:ELWxxDGT repeat protein